MNQVWILNRITAQVDPVPPVGPVPLPAEVQRGLDTIIFWVQTIGGSIAVLGLMILAIGLFFAHRNNGGGEFMGKVGWWVAGALLFGLAGVIAPIFLGL